MIRVPVPDTTELPEDEALRALFNDFGVLEDQPTEPMPLMLEESAEDRLLKKVRSIFGELNDDPTR